MATLLELRELATDSVLLQRTQSALTLATYNMLVGTPTEDEKRWAASMLKDPAAEASKALRFMLAGFNAMNPDAIRAATDNQLLSALDGIVDVLVTASTPRASA